MTAPRYARLASKLLTGTREQPEVPPTAEARAAAIAAVAQALAAHRRRRRWTQVGSGVAAAAAVVACMGGARWTMHHGPRTAPVAAATDRDVQIVAQSVGGGASVVVSGATAPLAEGRTIPEGSRLVTPANSRATLAFSTGTSVTLGEGTELTVGGDGQKQMLRLASGWVDLHVAKLAPDARFLVDTADSEVEVRGTRFRVALAKSDPSCGGGTVTRVTVTEGVVVVRHEGVEARVAAGEQWPAGCAKVATAAPAYAPMARLQSGGEGVSGSSLSAQNDLYARAIASKNRGDARVALAEFDRYLAKYPSAQNAQDAAIERLRLLRTVSAARAEAAARQYLAAYPNGSGRDLAEAILAEAP